MTNFFLNNDDKKEVSIYEMKPYQVVWARNLLYLLILISIIGVLFNEFIILKNDDIDGVIVDAVINLVFCFIPYFINKGKNWARIVYYISSVLYFLGLVQTLRFAFEENIFLGIFVIIELFILLIVFLLLISKESNDWFKKIQIHEWSEK
jgi:hypothetical protein